MEQLMEHRNSTTSSKRTTGARSAERTCAGCGKRASKTSMFRVVLGPDGQVAVDLAAHDQGRGAYVHPSAECVRRAAPAGLSKAFRTQVRCDEAELLRLLSAASVRRTRGLLVSAKRSGNLVFGREHVGKEWFDERLHLVIIASDGPQGDSAKFLEQAIATGHALVWGNRHELGALFDLDDVTVVGVRNASLAEAIADVCRLPDMVRAGAEVR